MKRLLTALFLFSLPLFFPQASYAHAFGQLYTLPIPVWLYIFGGGFTLIVSFVIIGFFVNEKKSKYTEKSVDISSSLFAKIITGKVFQVVMQAVSLCLWIIVIVAGFVGDQTPTNNLIPLFFWIIFLLGGIYGTAILGNFWKRLSPIYIIYTILKKFFKTPLFPYPENLGFLSVLGFYYLLVWMELLSRGLAVIPHILATLLLGYGIVHVILTILMGEKWLEHGELFTVIFGLLGKMSPFYVKQKNVYVRFPFAGLAHGSIRHKTLLLLVLFMLSSTAFDGLRATIVWRPVQYLTYPLFSFISHDPFVIFPIIQSIALFLSPFIFLSLYVISVFVMQKITRSKQSLTQLSLVFTLSLLPIALAYNVAHYFTLILSGAQSLLTLISDPFNKGWDLFHTGHNTMHTFLLRADTIWNIEVAAIVGGHIIAVYIAHLIALRVFPTHKKALTSQLPILVLMVVYTITGLWILSQPLTTGF